MSRSSVTPTLVKADIHYSENPYEKTFSKSETLSLDITVRLNPSRGLRQKKTFRYTRQVGLWEYRLSHASPRNENLWPRNHLVVDSLLSGICILYSQGRIKYMDTHICMFTHIQTIVNSQPYTCIHLHAHTYTHTSTLIELSPYIVSLVPPAIKKEQLEHKRFLNLHPNS